MTPLLPLVALALALAAPFLSREARTRPDPARLLVLAFLGLVAGAVVLKAAPAADRTPALVGLAFGLLAPLLGSWTGGLAAGVAAASAMHLFSANAAMGLAFVAGTGLSALALGGGEAAALAGVLVFAADDLGMRHSQLPAAAFVGSQTGVALAVGAFLAAFLPKGLAALRSVVVGLLTLLAGLLVARGLGEPNLTLCAGVGGLAGVVLHLLMLEEEGESPRVGLAAVVGVGLATVAFGLGRGAGMGLAALAAVGVLLAVDNRRAVLALGPLVGLVLYRVLREAGTGATRALDIAQHYTLLALVFGLVLPLLPSDWLRAARTPTLPSLRGEDSRSALGAALWGIVVLAAAPLLVVALGLRGGIGFVVGLGAAGLVEALRAPSSSPRNSAPVHREFSTGDEEGVGGGEERSGTPSPTVPPFVPQGEPSLASLAIGVGLAGSTILALSWLGDESTLTRDAKTRLFAYAAVGIAILAAMLALANRRKGETK